MTPGVTEETVDAMSWKKSEDIIQAVRLEQYQWQPARRTYVPKKMGRKDRSVCLSGATNSWLR